MPARSFSADVLERGGVASIVMHGDITASADEALHSAYATATASGRRTVELDFADVDYINSTGIALIVRLLAQARRDGRDVSAVGLSDHYVEIFHITRLADYVHIVEKQTVTEPELQDAAVAPAAASATGGQA